MSSAPFRWRLFLGSCIVLLALVALVVAVGVVPPVRAGDVPNITSDRAVPAFWVIAAIHLVAALALLGVLVLSKGHDRVSTSVLLITGVVIWLAGFALGDAGKAPLEVEPSLQTVSVLLFGCVAADALAGALAIAATRIRPVSA